MIVFGDARRIWNVRDEVARIRTIRDPLTSLIEIGKLAQGVLDAGVDSAVLHVLLLAAGRGTPLHQSFWDLLTDLPEEVEVTEPEGYAFYGVHPALYAAAARRLPRQKSWLVIGIRSIGTSLGAAVAGVLPNARLITVRPEGDPFDRVVRERIPEAHAYAVVDEGPGLSGSSFAAVGARIDSDNVWYFPSHGGDPGPRAGEERLRWWRSRRKAFVDFDSWFDPGTLAEGAVEEWSAGRWRAHRFASAADWPAAHLQQERRKYFFPDANLVARFAGLGVRGEELFARTQLLADAGFTPPPRALRHGFLLTDAVTDAHPPADRARLFDTVARYIAHLTRFPATGGASPQRLAEMARVNIGAADLEFPSHASPIAGDNRMHRWEWLATTDGRLLKTDLDHHAGHDLVGCQDPAWDLAGAIIELEATEAEARSLVRQVEQRTGRSWPASVLRFYTTCYLAFWTGYYTMAMEVCGADEGPRLRREVARYRASIA
ncbi:MAG TPA: hypothetical protein VGR02_21530 [Thermoanaerobaculia bacterium]|jgi:hypothetical protein|nr:hypothetical protein [Thermoanaerobaculia bacterium]